VPVPDPARLGVPLDLNLLAHRQPPDLRLVKVGSYPLVVQIGQLQQQLALFGKLRGPGIEAVDRSRRRSMRTEVCATTCRAAVRLASASASAACARAISAGE
jgi:hypothetical protein